MKHQSIKALTLLFFGLSATAFSQNVGVNITGTPADVSAILDLNTGNASIFSAASGKAMGFLIPNVALSGVNDAATILNPATSLLVYVPSGSGLSPAGYYYNSGTPASPVWTLFTTGTSGSGTTNYYARWTPNGTTLGIGFTEDNGTAISMSNPASAPIAGNMLTVTGNATSTTAILGTTAQATGYGVEGTNSAGSGTTAGVYGTSTSAAGSGVLGVDNIANGAGVKGSNTQITGTSTGVNGSVGTYNAPVWGAVGVYGSANNNTTYGVEGNNPSGDPTGGAGVIGYDYSGTGVIGSNDLITQVGFYHGPHGTGGNFFSAYQGLVGSYNMTGAGGTGILGIGYSSAGPVNPNSGYGNDFGILGDFGGSAGGAGNGAAVGGFIGATAVPAYYAAVMGGSNSTDYGVLGYNTLAGGYPLAAINSTGITGNGLFVSGVSYMAGKAGIFTNAPARALEIGGVANTARIDGLGSTGTTYNIASATNVGDLVYANNANGDLWSIPAPSAASILSASASGVISWSPVSTFTGFIWNQNTAAQTVANYWISGMGTMNGGILVNGGAASINATTANTTTIGNGTNALTENGNYLLNFNNGAATTGIGTGSTTGNINIGAAGTSSQVVSIESGNGASGQVNISVGTPIAGQADAVNINYGTNEATYINSGNTSGNTYIGATGSSTGNVHIADNASGNGNVTIGFLGGGANQKVNIYGGNTGTGAVNINASTAALTPTYIGTGTTTGLVSIGNATGLTGIDELTPVNTLDIFGSVGYQMTPTATILTASQTLDATFCTVLANPTAGAFTITLPTAGATNIRRFYTIIYDGSNTNAVTIQAATGSIYTGTTVNASLSLTAGSITVQSNGTNWYVTSDWGGGTTTPPSGSGLNNYYARWTPNGSTLGVGFTEDNGTSISMSNPASAPVNTQMLTVTGNATQVNAIVGTTAAATGYGVEGVSTATTGTTSAVYSTSANTTAGSSAERANNTATTGSATGVIGNVGVLTNPGAPTGVYGQAAPTTAIASYGVEGLVSSGTGGAAVYGSNTSVSAGTQIGVLGTATGTATTNIGGQFSASAATNNHAINIAAGDLETNGTPGTTGQVLTSQGANAVPQWTTFTPAMTVTSGNETGAYVTGIAGLWYITGVTMNFTAPSATTLVTLEISGEAFTQGVAATNYSDISIGIYVDGATLENGYQSVRCITNVAGNFGRGNYLVTYTGTFSAGVHTMQIIYNLIGGSAGVIGPWVTSDGVNIPTVYTAIVY